MREIICAEAVGWLSQHLGSGAVITSMPDMDELAMQEGAYCDWFIDAALACMDATAAGQPCMFLQTDRKIAGRTLSKPSLVAKAASIKGLQLKWHKVVIRAVDSVNLYRPGFSHLLCYGDASCKPGKATPDVLRRGEAFYKNGIPFNVAELCLDMLKPGAKVIAPFCGRGTIPILAEQRGFESIGIDSDPEMVKIASEYALKHPDEVEEA